jgi:hypothetical protein
MNADALTAFADEMSKLAYYDDELPVLDPTASRKSNVMRSFTRMSAIDTIPSIAGAFLGGIGADALVRKVTRGTIPHSNADKIMRILTATFGAGFGGAAGSMASTAANYMKESKEEQRRIANAARRQQMFKYGGVLNRLGGIIDTGTAASVSDTLSARIPYLTGLALATRTHGSDKYMSPQKKVVQADLTAQAANLGAATFGAGGALLALALLHRK